MHKNAIRFFIAALALAVLWAGLPVSAAPATPNWLDTVQTSLTEDEETGLGLAFRFALSASLDIVMDDDYTFNKEASSITYDGVRRPLLAMGAVVTNDPAIGKAADLMVREGVNKKGTVVDIDARTLCEVSDEHCAFAVRIVRIPNHPSTKKAPIFARPYYLVDVDGEVVTVYGDVVHSSYQEEWDALYYYTLPTPGTDMDGLGRIFVDRVSVENRTVTLVLNNAGDLMPVGNSYVEYTCFDENGQELAVKQFEIGSLWSKTKCFYTIELPEGTKELRQTAAQITYATQTGTDVDGRGRIYLGAISVDGSAATIEIQNKTSKWMTEETNYIDFTYYGADGASVGTGRLYLGSLRAGTSRTYTLELPAGAKDIALTGSKIVYWTEWA